MALDVIVGLQRGDEGKGRFVDLVAGQYDVIARGNGGANAGHTVVPPGLKPIALHQLPSGITYPDKLNIIGNGVYLDAVRLKGELAAIRAVGLSATPKNLLISDSAHLVLPHHLLLDTLRENSTGAQGSTQAGISYVAADKYLRESIRAESIADTKQLFERAYDGLCRVAPDVDCAQHKATAEAYVAAATELLPYIGDSIMELNHRLQAGQHVLAEGAQAFWLDINHGMYPAVTSSSTTVAGLLDGLGLSAKHLRTVTGVAKIMKSHVGGGPFVTEIHDLELAERIRGPFGQTDSEYGSTTKRPRRVGYPDLVELGKAIEVNGVDSLVLSKMDLVSRYGDTMQVATAYRHGKTETKTAPSSAVRLAECQPVYQEFQTWGAINHDGELPTEARDCVDFIEDFLHTKISMLGVGPERDKVIRLA